METAFASQFRMVVLGPPCAGKTTVAARAAKEIMLAHISFHKLCRLEYQNNTEVGLLWNEYMKKNLPFQKGMANRIVQPHLDQNPRVVLDGFPKRTDELKFLRERYGVIQAVLILEVPVEVLLSRAHRRLHCPKCWTGVAVAAKGESICPQCGTKGERRNDDVEPEFWKRLKDFEQYGEEMYQGLRSFSHRALRVSNSDDEIFDLSILKEPLGVGYKGGDDDRNCNHS